MSARVELEKFDGKGDFGLWKKKMEALLVQQKVAKALLDPSKLPTTLSELEKEEIHDIAYSTIILHLSDNVLRRVSKILKVKELWSKLEELYMPKTLTNIIFLKERFFCFKMEPSKSLEENLDDFNVICTELQNTGETVNEKDQAVILLNSLPESFKEVKSAIKYGRDELTLDKILNSLRLRDLELKLEKKEPEALFVKDRQQYKEKGSQNKGQNSQSKGQGSQRDTRQRGRSQNSSKQPDKSNIKCNYCHKIGHYKSECYQLKRKNNKQPYKENKNSANLHEGYESAEVLMITDKDNTDEWILDSGCTFHMTPYRHYFTEISEFEGGRVIMGNNQHCSVRGIGTIKLRLADGSLKILKSVRFVPELKRNLISLGTLDRAGFTYKSENGQLKVSKDKALKLVGVLKDGLYVLQGKTELGEVNAIIDPASKEMSLWHRRLAHIGEKGLECLKRQGLLGNKRLGKLVFCEHCALGKQSRASFKPATHNTKERLDYIHSDLWGPARVGTHGGARYFLTLIDDFSRKVWVFLLKTKDEVFERFLEWKTLLENQTGQKIKYLRTDNGLEYLNDKFANLCKSSGISRHLTTTRTPQQNGLAERFNRTILERVRCMLSNAQLPKTFWGEAVNTAVYVINRSSSSALNLKLLRKYGQVIHRV